MKTLIKLLVLVVSLSSFAQQGFNYKAIIKDDNGNVIANDLIVVQFIVYEGAALTNNVYQESHTPTTDDNGLIIINIGEGTTSDDFNTINWGNDQHFLNVQINTGSGLVDMGTTEFMAVPYAKQAEIAANVTGLEKITENDGTTDNTGWRLIGADPIFYGPIGDDAIDLSYSSSIGTIEHGATGAVSFAVGASTVSSGVISTAMGYGSYASGDFSTALGRFTHASGDNSIAIGNGSSASGINSTALGLNTIASGETSLCTGYYTEAPGNYSTAMGLFSTASGNASFANGSGSTANGNISTALGYNTNADAFVDTAIGRFNVGGGTADSWVETDPLFEIGNGSDNNNKSNALTILKNGTITAPSFDISEITDDKALITKEYLETNGVTGLEKITENDGTTDKTGWRLVGADPAHYGPIGEHAIDLSTGGSSSFTTKGATGDYSIAIGDGTHAEGDYSIAVGQYSTASGNYSAAFGNSTAEGQFSTSMGQWGKALGQSTTVMGVNTEATAFASTAMGLFNEDVVNAVLMVGSGSSDSNRKNAITVLNNGNIGLGEITNPVEILQIPEDEYLRLGIIRIKGYSNAFIIGNATTDMLGFYTNNEWGPQSNNTVSLGSSGYRWSEIWSTNPLNISSDSRLKKNIIPLNYGLTEVMQLKPVTYQWKTGKQDVKMGFIAQEVEPVIPELVSLEKNQDSTRDDTRKTPNETYYAMSYTEIIPVLTKAIQEQQHIIEEQKEQINTQNSKIELLENSLQALTQRFEKIEAIRN